MLSCAKPAYCTHSHGSMNADVLMPWHAGPCFAQDRPKWRRGAFHYGLIQASQHWHGQHSTACSKLWMSVSLPESLCAVSRGDQQKSCPACNCCLKAARHSTAQHDTAQHSAAQHSTARHSAAQQSAAHDVNLLNCVPASATSHKLGVLQIPSWVCAGLCWLAWQSYDSVHQVTVCDVIA